MSSALPPYVHGCVSSFPISHRNRGPRCLQSPWLLHTLVESSEGILVKSLSQGLALDLDQAGWLEGQILRPYPTHHCKPRPAKFSEYPYETRCRVFLVSSLQKMNGSWTSARLMVVLGLSLLGLSRVYCITKMNER